MIKEFLNSNKSPRFIGDKSVISASIPKKLKLELEKPGL